MPMSWIIKAENIGKKYIISHQKKQRYQTIQEETIKLAKKGVKKILSPFISKYRDNTPRKEDFWALRDINFEIEQGDRVGIIGRNGAGKSTLLKILSRITEPTTGKFTAKGRIASLLEVGTGFHPELTGRENIFLNGSILGMSRAEIKKKFDEIVAFAEVEKFLDTPVKRYSSGMYVRLAFAVAAHLEPEILIVDEVLAVGDAQFQKKCLGKMEEVSKGEGRTVLFVSHNMGAIQNLCNNCIVLDKGKILVRSKTSEAISYYSSLGLSNSLGEVILENHKNRLSGMQKILKKVTLKSVDGNIKNDFFQNEDICIEIEYETNNYEHLAGAGFIIYSIEGVRVGGGNTYMNFQPPHIIPNKGKIQFIIKREQINIGNFSVTVSLGDHQGGLVDKVETAIDFSILQYDIYGTGYLLRKEDGIMSLNFNSKIFTE
ncbi:MAG: Teichoic acids export ATP-binding protein TagH [Spirochaetes bacterium ADurb.Bin133]|jgi:lipopolysaccharide transport system ATP-binding protein|nr:MAG: Teichoic acids export ATP-binding protein TagH [Spirochaetes bacterium ADurb.Bin133]